MEDEYNESEENEEGKHYLTSEICSSLQSAMSARCDELIRLMCCLSNSFFDAVCKSGYRMLNEIYDNCFYGDFYGYGVCVTGYAQFNPPNEDFAIGLEDSLNALLDDIFWGNVYKQCNVDFDQPIVSVDDIYRLNEEVRNTESTVYGSLMYPLVEDGSDAAEFAGPAQAALSTLWSAFSVSFSKMYEEMYDLKQRIDNEIRLLSSASRIGSVLNDSSSVRWTM